MLIQDTNSISYRYQYNIQENLIQLDKLLFENIYIEM